METLVATLAEFLDYKEVKLPRSNSKPVTLKPAADSVTTPPNVPAELIVECSETAVNLTHPDRQPIPANFVAEFPLPTVAKSTLPEDEEFNSIICEFADMLPEKLEEIQKTLEVGSFEEIKKFGHWLVGSAGTVGLEPFVAPAREIENMVTFDHRRLENLIDHLSMLCDRIEVPQKC
jgi:HPt (histidine-containing phosphotransfer) domain-containing protein